MFTMRTTSGAPDPSGPVPRTGCRHRGAARSAADGRAVRPPAPSQVGQPDPYRGDQELRPVAQLLEAAPATGAASARAQQRHHEQPGQPHHQRRGQHRQQDRLPDSQRPGIALQQPDHPAVERRRCAAVGRPARARRTPRCRPPASMPGCYRLSGPPGTLRAGSPRVVWRAASVAAGPGGDKRGRTGKPRADLEGGRAWNCRSYARSTPVLDLVLGVPRRVPQLRGRADRTGAALARAGRARLLRRGPVDRRRARRRGPGT